MSKSPTNVGEVTESLLHYAALMFELFELCGLKPIIDYAYYAHDVHDVGLKFCAYFLKTMSFMKTGCTGLLAVPSDSSWAVVSFCTTFYVFT